MYAAGGKPAVFKPEESFLTVNDVSEYLKIKASTLYQWVASGGIPFFRLGRLIRFRKEEIDVWLESQRGQGQKPAPGPLRIPGTDIDRLVRRAIDEARQPRYDSLRGRPGRSRDVGKEGEDGLISKTPDLVDELHVQRKALQKIHGDRG